MSYFLRGVLCQQRACALRHRSLRRFFQDFGHPLRRRLDHLTFGEYHPEAELAGPLECSLVLFTRLHRTQRQALAVPPGIPLSGTSPTRTGVERSSPKELRRSSTGVPQGMPH